MLETGRILRKWKQGFMIWIAFIVAGIALNVGAFLLPQHPIHNHILDSVSVFQQEGTFPYLIPGYKGTILDNNSDAWMLLLADFDGNEGIVDKAMSGYYWVYPCENTGMVGTDNLTVMGDKEPCGVNQYSRYWHGWLFFLRFGLLFFNYSDLRALNMILQFVLIITCFILLERRGLSDYLFAFLTAMLVLVPPATAFSFEYSFIFYIFMSGMIVMLRYHERIESDLGYSLYFFILGLCTSYFDFLTFPLLTLGMPLVTVGLLREKHKTDIEFNYISEIIWYSIAWSIGYAGMWVSKWVVGSLLTSHNIVRDAVSQVILRTSHTNGLGELSNVKISYLYTICANMGVICKGPYILLFIVSILYSVRKLRKTKCNFRKRMNAAVSFLFIAAMPFVWYYFAMNHSALHNHFTYRELVLCVFSGLCAIERFSGADKMLVI